MPRRSSSRRLAHEPSGSRVGRTGWRREGSGVIGSRALAAPKPQLGRVNKAHRLLFQAQMKTSNQTAKRAMHRLCNRYLARSRRPRWGSHLYAEDVENLARPADTFLDVL